jgi:hypothetical protein
MNTQGTTVKTSSVRTRLLSIAAKVSLIAGPLGYVLIETAGVQHP